jgi:hypothetical protein
LFPPFFQNFRKSRCFLLPCTNATSSICFKVNATPKSSKLVLLHSTTEICASATFCSFCV